MTEHWVPHLYTKHSPVQQSLAIEMLEQENLNKKLKILDVGCGDGKITNWIVDSSSSSSVTGLDASSDMITFARENYAKCNFIHQRIEQYSEANAFDLVTSFNCLHWIENIRSALHNIYQSMQSGARFIGLIYPRCELLWQAAEILEKSSDYHHYFKNFSNPYQFHTLASFKQLLIKAGFDEAKITLCQESRSFCFSTEETLYNYVLGWLPHAKITPPEFLQSWITVFRRLTEQTQKNDIVMDYDVIMFTCNK